MVFFAGSRVQGCLRTCVAVERTSLETLRGYFFHAHTKKQFGSCTSFIDVLITLQWNEFCGSTLSDRIDFTITQQHKKKLSARTLMAAEMANSACVRVCTIQDFYRYAVNLINTVALWHLVERRWLIYSVWHQHSNKVIQLFARTFAGPRCKSKLFYNSDCGAHILFWHFNFWTTLYEKFIKYVTRVEKTSLGVLVNKVLLGKGGSLNRVIIPYVLNNVLMNMYWNYEEKTDFDHFWKIFKRRNFEKARKIHCTNLSLLKNSILCILQISRVVKNIWRIINTIASMELTNMLGCLSCLWPFPCVAISRLRKSQSERSDLPWTTLPYNKMWCNYTLLLTGINGYLWRKSSWNCGTKISEH